MTMKPITCACILQVVLIFSRCTANLGILVVDNVLTAMECDGLLSKIDDPLSFGQLDTIKSYRQDKALTPVSLSSSLEEQLGNAFVHASQSCESMEQSSCGLMNATTMFGNEMKHDSATQNIPTFEYGRSLLQISSILKTTESHQDSFRDPSHAERVHDPQDFLTGFVFLNDHATGYFKQGSGMVTPKQGSLVVFHGRTEHNTVLPDGSTSPMHLLGPFTVTLDRELVPVGNSPVTPAPATVAPDTPVPSQNPTLKPTPLPSPKPTLLPTPFPSPKPTVQPTSLPSRNPTMRPTALPSRKPTAQPTRRRDAAPKSRRGKGGR